MVKMKLLDEKPSWPSGYLSGIACQETPTSPRIRIDMEQSLSANAPWPATYDWKISSIALGKFGYGAILDMPAQNPRSRVFETGVDNEMVRWPAGLTPVMPDKYNEPELEDPQNVDPNRPR